MLLLQTKEIVKIEDLEDTRDICYEMASKHGGATYYPMTHKAISYTDTIDDELEILQTVVFSVGRQVSIFIPSNVKGVEELKSQQAQVEKIQRYYTGDLQYALGHWYNSETDLIDVEMIAVFTFQNRDNFTIQSAIELARVIKLTMKQQSVAVEIGDYLLLI